MIGSQDDKLKMELKQLIIEECDKDMEAGNIGDDETLFGPDTKLELDSMDALQISMALQKKYGINETDSKKLKKVMVSINTLAKYIQAK